MKRMCFNYLVMVFITLFVVACSQGTCLPNGMSDKIYTFPNGASLYGNTDLNIQAGGSFSTTYILTGGSGNTNLTLTTSDPLPAIQYSKLDEKVCFLCGSFNPENLIIINGNQESSSILTVKVSSNLPVDKYTLNLYATYSSNGDALPTMQIGQININVTANPNPSDKHYYAFIAEQESGILYCNIGNNGDVGKCLRESAPIATNTWSPTGLSITKVNGVDYAYVVDSSDNKNVWACPVNADGSFGACINALTYSAGIGVYYQISFAFVNGQQYAYIADSGTWITKCTVAQDATLTSCNNYDLAISTSGALQAYGVVVQNIGESQYAYISDVHSIGNVCHEYKCSIESDGGIKDNCVDTSGGQSGVTWCPRTATFNNYGVDATQYAYVSSLPQDGSTGTVYQCSINQQDGTFDQCNATPTSGVGWFPYMSGFLGGLSPYIYTISRQDSGAGNNDLYKCAVDITTGNIKSGECYIQQSSLASGNLADAIIIYGL